MDASASLVILILFFVESFSPSMTSNDTFVYIPGDVVLGALFPIHRSTDGFCGKINPQDGIQRLVAAMLALKTVNEELQDATGFTMGMDARDTCYSNYLALEESLRFAQTRYRVEPASIDGNQCLGESNSTDRVDTTANKVIGVIGPATSEESVQVATLLKLFKLPQISYFATSPVLSDREVFSYFLRTVPSDVYQAEALIAIFNHFQWNYITMLYENTNYGENGAIAIEERVQTAGLCIGMKTRVSMRDTDDVLRGVVDKLLRQNNTNGEIITLLYVRFDLAIRIFRIVGETADVNRIKWVGVDAWIGREMPDDKAVKMAAKHAVGVTLQAKFIPGFLDYFKEEVRQKVRANHTWFREYWEQLFQCRFVTTSKKDTAKCSGYEKFQDLKEFEEKKTLFTIRDSIYVFGKALVDMHRDKCKGDKSICPELKQTLEKGKKILHYLRKVTDPFNTTFRFVNETDGPPLYSVLRYENSKDTSKYAWKMIGNFSDTVGLYLYQTVSSLGHTSSVCSDTCRPGNFRKKIANRPCCWDCSACSRNEYINNSDPYSCLTCSRGFTPGSARNSCMPIVASYFTFSDPFAIVLTSFSGIGIIVCGIVLVVFLTQRETPIVKASSLSTSVLLLAGIFLSFASVFFIFSPPSVSTCSFTRIILGLSYTIGYSAIFAKLYMLSNAFSTERQSFNSQIKSSKLSLLTRDKVLPAHALVIALTLTIVHLTGLLIWIIMEAPKVENTYPVLDGQVINIVICNDALGYSYISVLIWPFVLMMCCVAYAVKLRRLPEGFNDKNNIVYCTSISIIIWVVFVPVYAISSNNNLRVIALSLALFVHGVLLLSTLFLPKLYIIVFRKDKNTKECVMSSRSPTRTPLSNLSGSKRRFSDTSLRQEGRQYSQSSQATQTVMANGDVSGLGEFQKHVMLETPPTLTCSEKEDSVCGTLPFKSKVYKRFLSKESTSSSLATGDISLTTLKQTLGTGAFGESTCTNSNTNTNDVAPSGMKDEKNEKTEKVDSADMGNLGDLRVKGENSNPVHACTDAVINCEDTGDLKRVNDFISSTQKTNTAGKGSYLRRHSNSNPDLVSKSRLATLQNLSMRKP